MTNSRSRNTKGARARSVVATAKNKALRGVQKVSALAPQARRRGKDRPSAVFKRLAEEGPGHFHLFPERHPDPTEDEVLEEVVQSLSDPRHLRFMHRLAFLRRAWEVWLQCELAVELQWRDITSSRSVSSEDPLYGVFEKRSKEKMDLVVLDPSWCPHAQREVCRITGFELKCRSYKTPLFSDSGSLMQLMLQDIKKIDNGILSKSAAEFSDKEFGNFYSIAITGDPRDLLRESIGNGQQRTKLGKEIHWCYLDKMSNFNIREDLERCRGWRTAPYVNLYLIWHKGVVKSHKSQSNPQEK
ncbi:MAG: hypothetical protein Q9159_003002 [Coniocarpon cinnabarinum]